MTKAERQMVQDLDPRLRDQAATICKIERTMRKKVKEQIPIFEKMPAAQTATNTQGEKVLKNNPAMQEIRAMFRDYCNIVKVQQDIIGNKAEQPEITQIDFIRDKIKIAK